MDYQVLISGGGIGGLLLAAKLASCGIRTGILEQSRTPSHLYKGELLQPKSLQILDELGVLQNVLARGHKIHDVEFTEYTGQAVFESALSYSVLDSPYNYSLMVPHEELKQILLDHISGWGTLSYLSPAKLMEYKNGRALVKKGTEMIELKADFYVGAEGRVSPTRKAMGVSKEEIHYNHHFLTVTIPRPASLLEGKMIVDGERMLGLFPLPGNLVRTVYKIKAGDYQSIKDKGLQKLQDSYRELFPTFSEEHVSALDSWKKIQLMIPVTYHSSSYVKQNMVLIGDAAHAVHPIIGEGMNLAIQDGDILGELLCWMYTNGKLDVEQLHWYERVRRNRVSFLMRLSHFGALGYSISHRWWQKARSRVLLNVSRDLPWEANQMTNISGMGMTKFRLRDFLVPVGISIQKQKQNTGRRFFTRQDDYPWERPYTGG